MSVVIDFIKESFDFFAFLLFLITSVFLYMDVLDYQNKKLDRESKFAKFVAIFYAAVSFILYIATKIIPS